MTKINSTQAVNHKYINGMEYLLRMKSFKGFSLNINNQIKSFRVTNKRTGTRIIEYNSKFVMPLTKEVILYKLAHLSKLHKTDDIVKADKYAWLWCEIRGFDMVLISEYLFSKKDRATEIRYRLNLLFRKILFPTGAKFQKLQAKLHKSKINFLKFFYGRRNRK